ncbi:ABC transporter ATP-binding protein [Streptosporangium sp. NPDC087985]|uniref:ABC transporter ATP-binding protein n=1 Tax=Streptosporangium sp. NPDC087985 TaxID=3366196 RepID=UPI0037FFD0A2
MSSTPVLEVSGLNVSFPAPHGKMMRRKGRISVVRDVDLFVGHGETLGLVGESGSGKSTVARALMRLVEPAGGSVRLKGREITGLSRKALRAARRDIQMVFQDPYSSLDPSMLIADSVGEPLEVHDGLRGRARDERVRELLELVGLGAHHLERYPAEFSGGQRQRIAIARALALNPSVLICDEAVSALDVSTQNQIIALLERLRAELGLGYLFISHDLAVVKHISHRVAVMYFGRIVEVGTTEDIFDRPAHPYTQALLSAVAEPDPVVQRSRRFEPLRGEIPDVSNPPPGCAFASRCLRSTDRCRTETPHLAPQGEDHTVACHHPLIAS